MFNRLKISRTVKFKALSLIFLASLVIPFSNCSKLNNYNGDAEFSSLNGAINATDLKLGTELYTKNCMSCHGQLTYTTKAGSSVQLISAALNSEPRMAHLSFLSAREIELISMALRGPSEIITDGKKTLFACDANTVRASAILKLSNREFSNALSSLLNDFTANLSQDSQLQGLLNNLSSDVSESQFTRQENSFLLSANMVSGLFNATYRAAELASTASGLVNYPNTANCLGSASITQACHLSFVKEFTSRAFRRSVSATESNALASATWNSALAKSDLITETFATIASYPDFIYKAYNTGSNHPTITSAVSASGVELANKLSFFLTGFPASNALRAIALSGGLDNPVTFQVEVNRMMTSGAGKANLQRLFRESYGYDVNSDLQYSAAFLNGSSTQNLQPAMVQEMDYFFTDEVLSKKSRFQDLMKSKNSLVTQASLGQIYGVGANASASTTLPEDRAGFLTRAAFLTKKSGNYTSPVKRGRYVMEQVLCDTVGDPPANAPTTVSEAQIVGQLVSTRSRYEHLTQKPNTTCLGCHSKINHYGFALEGFDSLGRKRNVESIFNSSDGQFLGSVPVNTVTAVQLHPSGSLTPVNDSIDMANGLASSNMAMMCFAKRLKTFDIRQAASKMDFCHMNEVLNVMYGANDNQGTIYDAIIAYVSSKDFRTWKY